MWSVARSDQPVALGLTGDSTGPTDFEDALTLPPFDPGLLR
jgi:hypothetical protein